MTLLARLAVLAALPVLLAGCLEVNARSDHLPDGSLKMSTEIAVRKEWVPALLEMYAATKDKPVGQGKASQNKTSKGKSGKSPKATFAVLCTKALIELLADGAPTPKPKKAAAAKPATPSAAVAPTVPPAIASAVSRRGDFDVCTLTETYTDPIPQYAAAMKKAAIPPDMATIALLPTGDGYRYGGAMRMADLIAADPTIKPGDRAEMAEATALIPRDIFVSMTVSGTRVENTNGTVNPDGTSVTWKLPLHELLDINLDAKHIELKADVFFK